MFKNKLEDIVFEKADELVKEGKAIYFSGESVLIYKNHLYVRSDKEKVYLK